MKIETHLSSVEIMLKIKQATKKAQMQLDAQVLKDSNVYCPMDTSTLIKSSILHSKIGSGRLIWKTPYAKAQYYGLPNKSHQKNPYATMKWFETAKAKRLKIWEDIANGKFI